MKPGSLMRVVGVCFALSLFVGGSAQAQMSVDGEMAVLFAASPAILPILPVVNEQLRFSRVREARNSVEAEVEQLFKDRNLKYPASEMFVRVFKWERTLEVWVRSSNHDEFQLLKSYPICALAGLLGPKKRQGDAQVPEGFYYIDKFNPVSSYHLSLGINYPNDRDRAANKDGSNLGGQIFIHGGCKSEGCLAITDDGIKELYWVALTTHARGQERIPVHIFPMRFNQIALKRVALLTQTDPELVAFWQSLRPGFDYFERTNRLPDVGVDADGRYRLNVNPGAVARAFQPVAP